MNSKSLKDEVMDKSVQNKRELGVTSDITGIHTITFNHSDITVNVKLTDVELRALNTAVSSLVKKLDDPDKLVSRTDRYKLKLANILLDRVTHTNEVLHPICRRLGIYPRAPETYDFKPETDEYIEALVAASKTIKNNAKMVALAEKQL